MARVLQHSILVLTIAIGLVGANSLVRDSQIDTERYQCEGSQAKYTNRYCETAGDVPGCYYLDIISVYQSCAVSCDGVVQDSVDEERCRQYHNCEQFVKEYCALTAPTTTSSTVSTTRQPSAQTTTSVIEKAKTGQANTKPSSQLNEETIAIIVIGVVLVIGTIIAASAVVVHKRRRSTTTTQGPTDSSRRERVPLTVVDGTNDGRANGASSLPAATTTIITQPSTEEETMFNGTQEGNYNEIPNGQTHHNDVSQLNPVLDPELH